MAGVVSIVQNSGQEYEGASQEIAKNISYFLSVDSAIAAKNSDPVQLPSAGTNYSYEVWIRCRCDLAPTTKIYNFKAWYESGMPASGQKITVNSSIVSSFQSPVNFQSAQGTRVDFTTKDSAGNSISLDGELINVGDYTPFLVFQLEVYPTADTGENTLEYIIEYDEI